MTRRIVAAVFGVIFIALAVLLLMSVERPIGIGTLFASLVVGSLGVDGCLSAFRNKRSLVERIGPLP